MTATTAVQTTEEHPIATPPGSTAFLPEDIAYAKTVLDQISKLSRTKYDSETQKNFLGYLAAHREPNESVRAVTDRALQAAKDAEELIAKNIEPGVEIKGPEDHDFIRQAFFANGPFEAKEYANYAAIAVLQERGFDIYRAPYYQTPFPTLVIREKFEAQAAPYESGPNQAPTRKKRRHEKPNRAEQDTQHGSTIELKPAKPSSTKIFNQRCHDLDQKLSEAENTNLSLRMQIEHAKTRQEDMLLSFDDYGLIKIDDALDTLRDMQTQIALLEEIQDDLLALASDDNPEILQTWLTPRLATLRQALSGVYKAHQVPDIDIAPVEPSDIQTEDLKPYKASRSEAVKERIALVETARTEQTRLEAELHTIQAQNDLLKDGHNYVVEQIAAIHAIRQNGEMYIDTLQKDNADLGAVLKKAGAFDKAPAHEDVPTAEQPAGAALAAG